MAKLNIAKLNALCSKNIFVLLLIIGVLLVVILALLIDTRVKEKFTSDATGEKMVLYHLNGCHHCTKLMPVWNELKQTHGAHMAEYEATAHPELMKHHNITSFPTIMKGKHVFKGERTHDNLKAFLMNQTGGGLSTGYYILIGVLGVILVIICGIWLKNYEPSFSESQQSQQTTRHLRIYKETGVYPSPGDPGY
jgi:hypothetical protein